MITEKYCGVHVLTVDGPSNPARDHKGPWNNIFAARERSRSYSLCVNDGSLVIPSHVCSDFGSAYTHRHKSTPFFFPSLSLSPSVLMVSHLPELILAAADTLFSFCWPQICATPDLRILFASRLLLKKQIHQRTLTLQRNSH